MIVFNLGWTQYAEISQYLDGIQLETTNVDTVTLQTLGGIEIISMAELNNVINDDPKLVPGITLTLCLYETYCQTRASSRTNVRY